MTKVSVVDLSCVNAPTSINTFEWIKPLLERKYPDIQFEYTYIDFQNQTDNLIMTNSILNKLRKMNYFILNYNE